MPAKQKKPRVKIIKRAQADVKLSVRSDGQITLVITNPDGLSHKETGNWSMISGYIMGWMIGDYIDEMTTATN